ncbi:hypothetical protein BMH32_12555 [Leucobacter sp. OLJS4]|uniref:DUF4229 domain-containing protein n=1 Tax=unclassified Leucobacter TaxID=2621730 RepID=UPI000C197086|nr:MULTISPECIES: DUF4229 domain-containing protein [unclassified Leucobacter]PIJ00846.1 hypothetical protein BMH30_15320 [Leucobacter sp. OLES1]PII87891.1 hypothetical protein BMH25_00385 [Leucobacter sp. OLCALW19]PII92875.1 hypothetical protein BMH27_04665 [Leucobacter sp. OLAS13]PII96342.1 hypothetical protein BMH26_00465 [Leucobacter sp. OLTLW20]PII96546.1 hypothetical protein BMH28_15155 [Leucobacter sp. OLCS4]
MKSRSAWLVYIVLRLLFFVVPFAALMLIGWTWWLSAIVATLAAVSLSVIFLNRQRSAASESIYAWRTKERTEDDVIEDDAVDAAEPRIADDSSDSAASSAPREQ